MLNVSRGLGDIQQPPANVPRLSCGQSENGTIKITNRRSTAAIPSKAIPAISCIALFDIMESPTLTLEEIKGNLCYYDAENPSNNLDCYDDEEERPKPRENCHCDNCFYGRDKLARYILSNSSG
jgi:hypothetical protein